MRRYDEIETVLHDWLPPEDEGEFDEPKFKRVNAEGNWEFIWVAQEDDEDGNPHDAYIERVVFEPDRFVYERYEDAMSYWSDDAVYDEDGNFIGVYDISYEYDEPTAVHTEWEDGWQHEAHAFDRKTLLAFLTDVLSGRLKRDKRPRKIHGGGTYSESFWARAMGSPAQRRRLPRTREKMAQWVRHMGWDAVRSGRGGEHVDYIDFDYKE